MSVVNCCKYRDSAVVLMRTVLSTVTELLAQGRPPLPLEPETSKVRPSQPPTIAGALIDTIGESTATGAEILTSAKATVRHDA